MWVCCDAFALHGRDCCTSILEVESAVYVHAFVRVCICICECVYCVYSCDVMPLFSIGLQVLYDCLLQVLYDCLLQVLYDCLLQVLYDCSPSGACSIYLLLVYAFVRVYMYMIMKGRLLIFML